MAGLDDNFALMGDWKSLSPSPRAFFSSVLGDDIASKPLSELEPCIASSTDDLFPPPQPTEPTPKNDASQLAVSGSHNQLPQIGSFSGEKSNLRGGLVERIAARAGFNAPRLNTESIRSSDLSMASGTPPSYMTISPGLSPTTLLDSPVFLSNSLAQPSPTTGKFPFVPNGNCRVSTSMLEANDKTKDNSFQDTTNSSFAFKPLAKPGSSFFLGEASNVVPQRPFPSIEVPVQSENSHQSPEATTVENQSKNSFQFQADISSESVQKGDEIHSILTEQKTFNNGNVGGSAEHSPLLDEQPDEEGDHNGGGGGGTTSEDGYNWRKYGQKQVKGSEYPRSYYKCTHLNCQVKKKVERSHEGHITEIIYKGAHNHPKPPNRRSVVGSSNSLIEMRMDIPEQAGLQNGGDGDLVWASTQKGIVDRRNDNIEVTSSVLVGPEHLKQSTSLQAQNGTMVESGDAVDASSTFSNDEDEDDRGTLGSVSLGYDGEEDESESKRRKIEAYATEMSGATRAIREPRVVVQTTSEVDILDDGYRWRKYGQKVVKGNPNPRSYYKCTNAGCTVRKHVERASHDLKSVITTYEGKHNHDVPAARNSSHMNSGGPASAAAASHTQVNVHQPEPSQVHHGGMARFERPSSLSSFGLPSGSRQQLVPHHGFSFGMSQPGLANLTMAGLGGPTQGKPPVLPGHPFLAQQRHQVNEMAGFMLSKGQPFGQPKTEPVSDSSLNLSSASSLYQQFIGRLPLGPQM